MTAEELIQFLGLEPLSIEGGYYRRSYYSDEKLPAGVLPGRAQIEHGVSSCIYFLLTSSTFGVFHSLASDETYHFYLGDPVDLVELHPNGECSTTVLGQDIFNGQKVQHTVLRETWQSSYLRPGGNWALMGCTVAPSFEESDFRLGNWEQLLRSHPKHHQLIMRLTKK
ncbi:MAG: cupin domain-containing protein [Candidatus Obscuribacterales bacterium]|nr:cupin domain-containing protein [Candidatus Obscuribacterales bacterium]